MRAVVKNGVGIFSPQGFLDGNVTFISIEDMEATLKLNVNMILISLKKVIFFNRNGLDNFIKLFTKMRLHNHSIVGFCDYDEKKFNAINKFYANDMNFSLFQTREIAFLFAKNFQHHEDKTILLYSEDKSQRTAIAIELHDNGYNPIIAQTQKEFEEKKKSSKYDIVIQNTFLGQMGQTVGARVSGYAIIYTISSFLDAQLANTFNIQYHNNSLNIGFRLFIFDAYKVISMNIHALNFLSKLASAAAEYNATLCFVGMSFDKTPISFKETLEDSGFMFFEQMDDILNNKELLEELGIGSTVPIKYKKMINKKTITELPNFIEATVSTIEMMTNAKAKKEAVNINTLTIEDKTDQLASSIGYYGDLDGMVVLVFPTNIAKQACELLIGEETNDQDMILDTLSELVNILGGKIKNILFDHNIKINITLPRSYTSMDELLGTVNGKKGVQVDLIFNQHKFIFFLTR
ncbi:FIG00470709: hypothetical protein [hydrothermal vent metagenome]|uniref:Chemotaxis phosphatase CheX-like domain-containing protein n=1 Tax=hydrothermal vent metagenome TaxID=652676 RepID=A0A1W1D4H5_9ZZZZ